MNALARPGPDATIGGFEIAVVKGPAGFISLKPEWDALFERIAQPHQLFQSHELLTCWADSFPADAGQTILVTARQHGRLVAIVPLAMTATVGVKRLRFMGAPIAQFDDALVDPACPDDICARLWSHIATLGADVVEVRRVRSDSHLARLLPETGHVTELSEAPLAELGRRVAGVDPGPAYSARERSNVRRRLRRLSECGEVSLTHYPPGEHAALLAERAIDIKRRALKAGNIYSPAVNSPGFEAFFHHAASRAASGLQVSAIELDGEPIAIDLSFICKETGFGHVLAAEPAFFSLGVGNLLVHHVFAVARASGANTFDLLAPADAYKMQHADRSTPVRSVIFPVTPLGRLFTLAYHRTAMPAARTILRQIATS